MNKRCLIVLSICLAVATGIGLAVWANACCTGDALCNGSHWKVYGEGCDYVFEVNLDRDCVGTSTVALKLTKEGGPEITYMMAVFDEGPPWPACVRYRVTRPLDPDTNYAYYFDTESGCPGRDPNQGWVLMNTNACD